MGAELGGPILSGGEEAGEFVEGLAGGSEGGKGRIFVFGDGLDEELAEFEDALCVSGGELFGADLVFLAFDGRGFLDFLDAVCQEVDLRIDVAIAAGEFVAPEEQGLAHGEGIGIGGAFLSGACESVEEVELAGGMEKGLVVVGAMQIDEEGADAFEEGERGGGVVDEGLGAAGSLDDAPQDQLAVFAGVQACVGQDGVNGLGVREAENGFDDALGFAGADGGGVGAFAEEQIESADEDGFAGAGFAGDDVESGFEGDGCFFDEREIFDSQQGKHEAEDSRRERAVEERNFRGSDRPTGSRWRPGPWRRGRIS